MSVSRLMADATCAPCHESWSSVHMQTLVLFYEAPHKHSGTIWVVMKSEGHNKFEDC